MSKNALNNKNEQVILMPRGFPKKFEQSSQSNDKYQFSVYLTAKEAESVKAVSIAQDLSVSSAIVELINAGLKDEKYQDAIKAYQNFRQSLTK